MYAIRSYYDSTLSATKQQKKDHFASSTGNRITSYNVCYTKLLRFLTSLFIVLFDNNLFWQSFIEKLGIDRLTDLVLLITMGLTILLLINLVFTLVAFRWVFKPFLALILLLSASVSYFVV